MFNGASDKLEKEKNAGYRSLEVRSDEEDIESNHDVNCAVQNLRKFRKMAKRLTKKLK